MCLSHGKQTKDKRESYGFWPVNAAIFFCLQ